MKKILILYLIFYSNFTFCQNTEVKPKQEGVFEFKGEEVRVSNEGGVAEGLPEITNTPPSQYKPKKVNTPDDELTFEERFKRHYDSAAGGEKIPSVPLSAINSPNPKIDEENNNFSDIIELMVIVFVIIVIIIIIFKELNLKKKRINIGRLPIKNQMEEKVPNVLEKKDNSSNIIIELEKLQKLKDKGAVDNDEFNYLKKKILGS